MIVGLYSSQPQQGKSTVAKAFVDVGFTPISFATAVKLCLAPILISLGVPEGGEYLWGSKKDQPIPNLGGNKTGGWLMSHFANDFMRDQVDPDVWLNIIKAQIEPNRHYVIDDVRYLNEAMWIQENGYLIQIIRPNFVLNHQRAGGSEGNLDDYRFDEIIINNQTLGILYEQTLELAKGLLQKA